MPASQATRRERLPRGIPPENDRPVRGCSQAESRCGLLTVRRRRLTACGIPPVGTLQHAFEWCYVYGAAAPTPGERFLLELPYPKADRFPRCLEACAQAFPDRLKSSLLDNSGAHTAPRLRGPENVRCVPLPADCPERNPIERVWRDLNDDLAWEQFADCAAQLDDVSHWLQAYDASPRQALTGYAYLVEAIYALNP